MADGNERSSESISREVFQANLAGLPAPTFAGRQTQDVHSALAGGPMDAHQWHDQLVYGAGQNSGTSDPANTALGYFFLVAIPVCLIAAIFPLYLMFYATDQVLGPPLSEYLHVEGILYAAPMRVFSTWVYPGIIALTLAIFFGLLLLLPRWLFAGLIGLLGIYVFEYSQNFKILAFLGASIGGLVYLTVWGFCVGYFARNFRRRKSISWRRRVAVPISAAVVAVLFGLSQLTMGGIYLSAAFSKAAVVWAYLPAAAMFFYTLIWLTIVAFIDRRFVS
ncbi:MAG: hypothetical protein QOD40_1158 [Alphaproteobacteria bacterium]|jgi:hypothetical protein|nr:hypothetical protein [Alphaproteobacteria bacterium]